MKIFVFLVLAFFIVSCSEGNDTRNNNPKNIAAPGPISANDLPYLYFSGKGANFARIRLWMGGEPDGGFTNALANALAAKTAGLKTLLVFFLSDHWPKDSPCDTPADFVASDLNGKITLVKDYIKTTLETLNSLGASFDLYAIGNELNACLASYSQMLCSEVFRRRFYQP